MQDASWALSGLLTVGFLIGAMTTSSTGLMVGWLILTVGMAVITVVRFRAARQPPGE